MARAYEFKGIQRSSGVDPTVIERVVRDLRGIAQSAAIDYALAVGRLIVGTFYQGDLGAWRSKGRKEFSFRRLAAHPELPMAPAMLYRCVAIFELSERSGGVSKWKHLGVSHLRLVLPLCHEQQMHMLDRAEESQWTTQQLERQVGMLREEFRSKRGRPPLSQLTKTVHALHKFVDENGLLSGTKETLGSLDPIKLDELRLAISHFRSACEKVEKLLTIESPCESSSRERVA